MNIITVTFHGDVEAYSTSRKAIETELMNTGYQVYVDLDKKTNTSIMYPVNDEKSVRKAMAQMNKRRFLTAYLDGDERDEEVKRFNSVTVNRMVGQ